MIAPSRPPITIVEAPTNLGLSRGKDGEPRGCDRLPAALRAQGLHDRLRPERVRAVEPVSYPPGRTYDDGTLNARAIRPFLLNVAEAVTRVLADDGFPLVLGGDCSVLVAAGVAVARRGRHGLCALDAHLDFVRRPSTPTGVVAGMDLAIATGSGTPILADVDGRRPYFREEDVVAFGFHPADRAWRYVEEEFRASRMIGVSTVELRGRGVGRSAADVARRLRSAQTRGFWIHLDADVLDPSVMPAVDSPEPGGLSPEELVEVLHALLATGRAVGLSVAILDPALDPSGSCVRTMRDILVAALDPSPLEGPASA